ncbi:hypothetical protein J6590_022903 [Homalodisca vitripennis]|nr:hypothetical protein J6590_022903 [Homalodisca vitripennis]
MSKNINESESEVQWGHSLFVLMAFLLETTWNLRLSSKLKSQEMWLRYHSSISISDTRSSPPPKVAFCRSSDPAAVHSDSSKVIYSAATAVWLHLTLCQHSDISTSAKPVTRHMMWRTPWVRRLSQDNQIKQRRAWLLLGQVTAERSCPCKRPACPAIGGGSEVTFKPLVPSPNHHHNHHNPTTKPHTTNQPTTPPPQPPQPPQQTNTPPTNPTHHHHNHPTPQQKHTTNHPHTNHPTTPQPPQQKHKTHTPPPQHPPKQTHTKTTPPPPQHPTNKNTPTNPHTQPPHNHPNPGH